MSDKSHPLCSTVVLTILRLLSRSTFMTASELSRRLSAEGVSVQLRTLQKTLKTMSETPVYGVERNVDHKSYSYRLAAPVTLAFRPETPFSCGSPKSRSRRRFFYVCRMTTEKKRRRC